MGSDVWHICRLGVFHMGFAQVRPFASLLAAQPGVSRALTLFVNPPGYKNEVTDYVQELRTLMDAMQSDRLPETVYVTVFMEGLRTGLARTEVFRVHPYTFEEAVRVA